MAIVTIISTFVVSVLTYATYWIHCGDILTDSETYILYPAGTIVLFDKVGRFGLSWTKKIFSTDKYAPVLFISYAMIAMAMAAFIIDHGVWHFAEKDKRKKLELFYLPFNCLFVSSPVLTHQFYFYYQAFEVAFAFSIGALAAYWIMRWCIEGKIARLMGGMLFMVWSFATYQSIVPYYIAVQSLFFLIYLMYGNSSRGPWRLAFKMAFVFVAGLLIYQAGARIYPYLCYHATFASHSSLYVGWGKQSVGECLADMKGDAMRILQSALPGYSRYYLPVTCLFLFLAAWNIIRGNITRGNTTRGRKQIFLQMIVVFIFVTAPYEMTLLLGTYQILRSQLVYPVVLAATAGMTIIWLADTRIIKYPLMCLLAIMLFGQIDTANRIEQMVHTVAEADKNMAQRIYMETEEMRLQEDGTLVPMVFIGQWKPKLPYAGVQPWDATGISFFTIDSEGPHGSVRIARLMQCLGLDATEPTDEQYYHAEEIAMDMPAWPAKDCYKLWDGVLIVKLSGNVGGM